jgi:hypothetical protein
VLLCIGTNSTVHDQNRMKFDSNSFYLRPEQEMRSLFPELPEAADNTTRIAEQVDIKLEFGRAMLPDPGIPAGVAPIDHLRALCEEGLARRYPNATDDQRERLRYRPRLRRRLDHPLLPQRHRHRADAVPARIRALPERRAPRDARRRLRLRRRPPRGSDPLRLRTLRP